MRKLTVTTIFSVFFLIAGYFSWNEVVQYYVNGSPGNVDDLQGYFIAPLFTGFFWLLLNLFSLWIFRKIAVLTGAKESLFQTLYLLTNLFCLFSITWLATLGKHDSLDGLQLTQISLHFFTAIYLLSATLTFFIFVGLRRKFG